MPRGRFSADLTGLTFHRWTVICRTDERYANGGWYWRVRCECGTIGKVHTQGLRLGRSKSCGCYAREVAKKTMTTHGRSQKGTPGYRAYTRTKHEKIKYGLTPEQKQALLWRQHDSCAICGYEFGQKLGDYHIDHCHASGEVRGILCNSCNRGLGLFRDNGQSLKSAIEYLDRPTSRRLQPRT